MSNFEKIQSDELAECQDYQDWVDYQQDEAMQAMDSDLDYQLDFDGEFCGDYADESEWYSMEDLAVEMTEIFGVPHTLEPRTD